MSAFKDPFSDGIKLGSCSCGKHHSQAAHDAALAKAVDLPVEANEESLNRRTIESAIMRAVFPDDGERRRFLRAVGRSTAMAALSSFFPLGALEAMAQEKGPLEKKDLKVGFIPITCASPLLMADPLGFYKAQGLNVQMIKTAGWALIRDKVLNREYDASHMLAPMPIAMSMGIGSNPIPLNVATIQNTNGQAITCTSSTRTNAIRSSGRASSSPCPSSTRCTTSCSATTSPSTGWTRTRTSRSASCRRRRWWPTCAPATSTAILGPDPFNQRAVYDEVGFIHILSKEIWDGHPCCSFGVPTDFVKQNPNTFAALYRAILTAAKMARDPKNRRSWPKCCRRPPTSTSRRRCSNRC
jgi:nitrate/nitrite transport system substrate-binding protein